ncbi:Membrane-associated lipoprotein involved in thiamine biosynthesis [Sterolibacterium denitrificans]|uniref:FAD:protein FMN transferase n=2 Tax=Sterolibacterium denitrificans TaxID=157592 RepID=A0A656Z9B6_9PROT|nr:FAD:protein FMN transferase [Sterolibacterium denitrificans]KYC28906.1 thiamine biosynthesis protein ApbE [Sterolibacterium denitrificans]SMB23477.1 Membrane-associated lipoprotein involved in thiamine biosynthesis [Sterolibacterium denitrificans]
MRDGLRALFCAVCFVLLLAGCGRQDEPLVRQESFVFGTRVEVLVYGQTPERGNAAAAEVLREFDRLHRSFHAWQPSQLTALNEAIAVGKSLEVSKELAGLIRDSQAVAERGDGLFDPGIGRLIALWGFQNDEFKAQLPDPARLAEWQAARPSIGDLRLNGRRVGSRNRMVALDFGGYLKGVALDHAAALLKARGVHDALINIGGNVMALGSKGGKPWRVGIQHPRAPEPLASLDLRDGEAIGTSGDYQRYFELDGQRYCHLLDPRTGAPSRDTQAVTILLTPGAGDEGRTEGEGNIGMRSDALSKPLFIAGARWLEEARKLGIDQALRVDAAGTVYVTPALQARLKMEKSDVKLVVSALPLE